eukprot:759358-Hanusia_phi.AAC.3
MAMEQKQHKEAMKLYELALTQHDAYMARCCFSSSAINTTTFPYSAPPLPFPRYSFFCSSATTATFPSSSCTSSPVHVPQGCHRAGSDARARARGGGRQGASFELLSARSPVGRRGTGESGRAGGK